MTVSRVLQNRRNEVTDETYERVVAALQELNYVPVRTAVQNHQTRTNVIGVVPHSSNVLGFGLDLQTLGGISTRSAKLGYDVLIMQRGESEWMANRREVRFLDRRTDGYIFISPGSLEWRDVLAQLTEHRLPVVVCYRRDVPEGIAWVDPDNKEIIRLAVDTLVSAGHKSITYLALPWRVAWDGQLLADLSGQRTNFDDVQRQQFFKERIAHHGVAADAPVVRATGESADIVTDEDIDALLASGCTGVVCFTGALGLQLLDRLTKRGVRVPEDISIVSFDWSNKSRDMGLTHVTFTYEAVGQLAMDAWMGLMDGKPAAECSKIVPVTLVEGTSVAPPRR
jgi:DNA-binding LacI/PurR family transcriptional regulator